MIKISSNKLGFSVNISCDHGASNTNIFLKEMYYKLALDYPKFFKMDNLCKLGIIGTELLYRESQDFFKGRNRIGIILQNKSSSLDSDIHHQKGIADNIVSPSVFVYTLPNIVIAEISIKYQWDSEGVFFIGKDLDAVLLSQYSNILLKQKRTDLNLIGWIDVIENQYSLKLCIVESKIKAIELKNILA